MIIIDNYIINNNKYNIHNIFNLSMYLAIYVPMLGIQLCMFELKGLHNHFNE